MNPVLHSSKAMDHRTPPEFLDLVREIAPITYDPASQCGNPTEAAAWSFQTPDLTAWTIAPCAAHTGPDEECPQCLGTGLVERSGGGLSLEWPDTGLVFCNPPYGRHLGGRMDPDKILTRKPAKDGSEGTERVVVGRGTGWSRKMASHMGEGLYLVPTRTSTRWFRRLQKWANWRVDLDTRLKFLRPDGESQEGAPFDNSVFYRGPRGGAFMRVFGPRGTMIPGDGTLALLLDAATSGGI